MSRLAIKGFSLPWLQGSAVHLDIGRTRLMVQHGQSLNRHKLPSPIKSGTPGTDALAELGAVLEALCAALPEGKKTLEITVSDALARCWILERLPGLASPREIEGLAYDRMQQLYGDNPAEAAQWAVRVDATPFASHWPAIALPKSLLDLLLEKFGAHGCRIGKIQTRFVRSFNAQSGNSIHPPKHAVYSLETADGLTIGIRNAREWQALRTHPPLRLLGTNLPAMLRRDCRAVDLRIEDCHLQALRWPVKGQGL